MSERTADLIEKMHYLEKAFEECEADGGHFYGAGQISKIAHPEMQWQNFPNVNSFDEITYTSYVCGCGSRVPVQEGQDYMQRKYEKLKALNQHQEFCRKYKVAD